MEHAIIAVDLETTGFDPASEQIIEIGAARVRLTAAGRIEVGERFQIFAAPGRGIPAVITRLTGIRDADVSGAVSPEVAVAAFAAFVGEGDAWLLGHNVGFDVAFLERSGFPVGSGRLDTADLASIVLPAASSYALQRLAMEAGVAPGAAHRALDDALTCAHVLGWLAGRARALPPAVLEEARGHASLLGEPLAAFFDDALRAAVRGAWTAAELFPPPAPRAASATRSEVLPSPREALAPDGPLARAMVGFERRPEQVAFAVAVEQVMAEGGALLVEAGTGVGKSLAYLLPALVRVGLGERVIVSTHTLPLQDQLVRKDLPALQAALGTDIPVAVLKGRSNYLCPRRWQLFRTQVATREEARLALKTLVWRTVTLTGDRAEINLLGGEGQLWPRVSADDEACTARRCGGTPGGCYLDRARKDAAKAGLVAVNHALLLHDSLAGNTLLPPAEHVIVDEAHRLEDVAAEAYGFRLEDWRLRRDLDRVSRRPLVIEALRDERSEHAETLRREVGGAHERAAEVFEALRALARDSGAARLRITTGVRTRDDAWLPVELAGERLVDSLAAIGTAVERIVGQSTDEDQIAELLNAAAELGGARAAVQRGVHAPVAGDVVWLEVNNAGGSLALRVAPSHVGAIIRRAIVDTHRSTTFTSATLAVAASLDHVAERLGVADVAGALVLGSPFDFARQAALVVPSDIAMPNDERFPEDVAQVILDVAFGIDGRTLVLFTSHAALKEVASRLSALEEAGIALLAQGDGGSRRALLDRFAQGKAVLLGTQSFWEGVDLPGDILRCVIVARLPFAVPDDPLVQGRAERYDDPFLEYQVPEAALRLRQGFGRLIRTATDRGAVVLLDRRVLERDYGATFLASLPPARLRRVPLEDVGNVVAAFCAARG
ncbi:MAG: hypothetical protein EXR61_01760 [Chloroflexi bacterium]|nr:hypothetical protein [Chloroflexota bacterium]